MRATRHCMIPPASLIRLLQSTYSEPPSALGKSTYQTGNASWSRSDSTSQSVKRCGSRHGHSDSRLAAPSLIDHGSRSVRLRKRHVDGSTLEACYFLPLIMHSSCCCPPSHGRTGRARMIHHLREMSREYSTTRAQRAHICRVPRRLEHDFSCKPGHAARHFSPSSHVSPGKSR